MGYSVNLRTLTAKSKLGFGKYSEMMIGNILKVEPTYLAWIYYNKAKINYHKDILEQLGITEGFRIQKPGIDKGDMFSIWREKHYEDNDKQRMADWHQKNLYKKTKAMNQKIVENKLFSKGHMQKKNHGK